MEFKLPLELLRCPDCSRGSLAKTAALELICVHCGAFFPIVGNRPILLKHENKIFSIDDYRLSSSKTSAKSLSKWIPSPSVNMARHRVLRDLRLQLDNSCQTTRVLVIGSGGQRPWLDQLLGGVKSNRLVIYSDIDSSADVDLFCDGHDLPFQDGAMDAVVTTAVLEHVLYPERVSAEITRVLRHGGLLYSELPFMQQVHEGAYDFTRYTLSGHRRLFNRVSEIESGMIAGPATTMLWSLENLVLAFVSKPVFRKLTKVIVRLTFGWIKYFDYLLINRPEAMDGASCTYFYGANTGVPVGDVDIISKYVGAKHLKHV